MKVYNYIVITLGILILMQLAGLPTGAMDKIFDIFGLTFTEEGFTTASFSASDFFNAIFSIEGILAALALGGAVLIGILSRTSPENFIILPFITGTLALFLSGFISIMNYSIANHQIWISSIILMIFAPLTVGFILSLVEFFRGTD